MSKAWVTGNNPGVENLRQISSDIPKPGKKEVLIRVHACSLNYRDLMVTTGNYPGVTASGLIPFSDGAGEVVEVGPDVTKFKKGDRVYGIFFQNWIGGKPFANLGAQSLGGGIDGMLTYHRVLSEEGVVAMPKSLTYEEASTLPCSAVTAYNSLYYAPYPLVVGETVLVQGTGGVSIFALQFAKASGATVIATSSSDDKLKIAQKLGADHLINYKTHPDWDNKVHEFTNGRGVDHVVEVGGAGTFQKSLKSIRPGGHVGMIGVLTNKNANENGIASNLLYSSGIARGIYVGSREMYENMNRTIDNRQIKPVIDKVFPFDQVQDALKYLEEQKHVGKIVIKLD